MTHSELEFQCMALSHLVDTEVVERDPQKLASFDFNTLYVWMLHPHRGSDGEDVIDDTKTPLLGGRLGPRDESGNSVAEVAHKLGLRAH
jgi:hypothetical protein